MPLPKPKKDDTLDSFIYRCIQDEDMVNEYPNDQQRLAVCARQWKEKEQA